MKSKKSFCNKTMFFKDIIRLWPFWVIGVIVTQAAFTLPFFTSSLESLAYGYTNRLETLNNIRENMADIVTGYSEGFSYLILMIVMAIIAAVLVFKYLNNQCSSYMLHSLPVGRRTMYFTHYLSGFCMYLLPYLLVWCVLGGLNVLFGIHMGAAIFGYVLETVMIALFFYSLACFIVMLSNSSIMSLFMYAVINVMIYFFYDIVNEVINLFTYGSGTYSAGSFDWTLLVVWFSPIEYFRNALSKQGVTYSENAEYLRCYDGVAVGDFHFESVLSCVIYLLPTIFFFVAALVLYQKRKLERVDENLVFPWSKVIYRVVFCCCGSYIFTWLMYYLTYAVFGHLVTYKYSFLIGMFYLLIGALLCYLICDMILAKSFFIWKRLSYMQMGLITIGILLIFVGGHHAYLQHSIVDTEKIKAVNIYFNGDDFRITEPERMDELLALQKAVMEQGGDRIMAEAEEPPMESSIASEFPDGANTSCYMELKYDLKNKGKIYRSYRITFEEEKLLTDIILYLNDTKYLADTVLSKYFKKEYIKEVLFYPRDLYYEYQGTEITQEEEMYDALMMDLQEGHILFGNIYKRNYRGFVDCGKRVGSLDVEYWDIESEEISELEFDEYEDYDDYDDYDDYEGYIDDRNQSFVITDECTHVLRVLEQEGLSIQ